MKNKWCVNVVFLFFLVGICVCACTQDSNSSNNSRWTEEKIQEWYDNQPWLVGCNYIPATAINQIEMWSADTFDPEQIEKELDLLGENNSSDTVRSLYNEWCSLRFKPIDVPVFRSKKESINLCLDPDKFSEYRYIMKGRKLINISAKEIKYRQNNILLQDLYKVVLHIPPEKEVFRKIILYSYKD